MEKSPLIEKIERVIAPTAESLGYELVRTLLIGSGKPTLQIMAEKHDGTMGIEDCEILSKAVSALLDVENTMDGAYYLEVSSPGIDRPLTRLKDFKNHTGFDARIEVDPGVAGQKKFKGKIRDVENDSVVNLETEDGTIYGLPLSNILKAKLLLTDELIKSVQEKR